MLRTYSLGIPDFIINSFALLISFVFSTLLLWCFNSY